MSSHTVGYGNLSTYIYTLVRGCRPSIFFFTGGSGGWRVTRPPAGLQGGRLSYKLYDVSRINARIEGDLARKVAQVRKRKGLSVSDIVKQSLTRFCDAEIEASGGSYDALAAAGFLGCAEGPSDLSSNYKAHLTDSLNRKG